jgi:hypothetical protein
MEKKVIEIEIQDNSKTLKQQYKEAVLEVQKLADAFGATSIEVQNASKRAAELKDQIEDVNDAIQAQKGEGAFIALGKSLSSVASGFSAVEGAMGLVGAESEDVQKAMLRVQSAMALAQGLEGLEDAGRAFSQLKVTVNGLVTSTISGFQKMSLASKAFAITGIGLIITGLALVITYWEDVSKAIGLSTDEQDKYVAKQKRMNEQSKEMRENVSKESASFATLIAQLKATNSGSKEREDLIKKINKEYGTTLKNIKDERDFQSQLNTELASYLEYQKAKYLLQRNEEKIVKNLEVQDKLSNSIKNQKERVKLAEQANELEERAIDLLNQRKKADGTNETSADRERSKRLTNEANILKEQARILKEKAGVTSLEQEKFALSNLNKELEDANKRFENYGRAANDASAKVAELTNNGKKYVEQTVDATTKSVEAIDLTKDEYYIAEQKRLADLNKAELDSLDVIDSAKKANADMLLTEQELAIQKENESYKIKIDNAIKFGQDTEALEIEHLNNLNNINRTEQEKQYALDKEAKEKQIALDKETAEKKLEIQRALFQQKKDLQQQDLEMALQGVGIIKSIFEKSKGVQKAAVLAESAIGIAKIITSTQAANAAAIAKYSLVPGGQALSAAEIARNKIGAGLGIASNLVATGKALQSLGGGSAPSGGGDLGGIGGGGVISPNLNVVGNTGINQLATLQQQPVKAYVVSNDITSAQQFDLKVQQTSQL